jgi:hypothetical protein
METALNFFWKHKRLIIGVGLAVVLYQVWTYYRALQLAKAAGRGFGEGVQGTATGVFSILTAPARILATAAANVVDWITGPSPSTVAVGDLTYDQATGRYQSHDVSITAPAQDIPGTVTYPWSQN